MQSEGDAQSERKAVEISAVRLLARREHSVEELRRKLSARGYSEPAIETVLAKLEAKRLVSDERFITSFIHHHAQRGQGPIRIRAELRQQGIAADSVDVALDEAEIDWLAQAQLVYRRKFGSSPPRGLSGRAKQARFLQYRGFSSDQIRAVLKSDTDAGLDLDPDA
ncbi:MAG: regulatory protein RecX [Povalibacter sp.]